MSQNESSAVAGGMITVTLPDGSTRELPRGTTVIDLAYSICNGLGKATVGAKLNGDDRIADLRTPLTEDCSIALVTADTDDGLHVIRHSASHIMADAIVRLWPDARLSIGPSIADGFYYDIDLEHKLTEDDLEKIEKKMAEIIKANHGFDRCVVDREETLERYRGEGEIYKVELMEDYFDPRDEVTVYRHGDFEDLCAGPHVPSTGFIKAWKIQKTAGAYWRGDENRQMLQRVYGTAFNKKKELEEHLHLLEEAKKRDHRRLGADLDLYFLHPIAPASPFFHPKGATLYNMLVDYVRDLYVDYGYEEVITPQILDVQLWHTSGHYEKFKDGMFFSNIDDAEFGVKPMNCPCHALIFDSKMRSYRNLPVRMADFGRLHRYERAGATSGLTRVRTFSQDDAHIFCREDQVEEEIASVVRLLRQIYDDFRFPGVKVYLSTRPEKSLGSDEIWEKAEAGLEKALEANGLEFTVNPGDGAFYGPKIDFVVLDALRREWQLGTIQLDFNMALRFDLSYVDESGAKARPVVVHRAILGSLERFMGIVIEHFAGAFPVWLAPVQVRLLTITDAQNEYGEEVADELRAAGFRVETDFQNAKIGAKIREAHMQKIPYAAVIGDREVESGQIAIRERGGVDHGSMTPGAFMDMMRERIANKE